VLSNEEFLMSECYWICWFLGRV